MATLVEGARAEVQGSGANRYTLEHRGEVYSCTCPAWRNQQTRIEQRTCKHLRAYLGDASETARVGAASVRPRDPIRARRVSHFVEDRETRAERHAALDRAIERGPVLDDRMQTVYGLRLPRHLAYGIGFWMGLSEDERKEAWAYLGNGPVGVGTWYLDGAHERRVKPGLDERLDYRFRCDPPEMVSVFAGNSDGGHWGLWYDHPDELPRTIVMNYARDSAETWVCKRTLLESLRENVAGRDDEGAFDPAEWPHRTAIVAWLDVVLERELDTYTDDALRWLGERPRILGGLGSVGGAWEPCDEARGFDTVDARNEVYRRRDDAASVAVVAGWIDLARRELAAGSAARALCLGRELHWLDSDAWRDECTELLVGAYDRLGRGALGEIVKVHHRHRDLASVSVYEDPEPRPLVVAAVDGDAARVRAALADHAPSVAELTDALRSTNPAVLEILLGAAGAAHAADAAALAHIGDASLDEPSAEYPAVGEAAAAAKAAAIQIFTAHGARGKAFAAALRAGPELCASAIANADLGWRSARGRTALHIAAAHLSLEAVRALLDRGVDPTVRDLDGHSAYDAARAGWERTPRLAHEIFELLDARGGGPPKAVVAPTVAWSAGTKVRHKQFGEGIVEAVTGAGDEAKLTVKFGAGTKVLVARFVTPSA